MVDVPCITISVQGARILVASVTDLFRFIRGFYIVTKFSLVVVEDYGLDVAHGTIAQVKRVAVKDFMQGVQLKKVLVKQ